MKIVTAENGKKRIKISKSEWETIGKKNGWMKIVTASNGKKTVKISKSEWETIGKKHGWMKTAKVLNVTDEMKQALNKLLPQIIQDINSIGQTGENGRKIYPQHLQPREIIFTDPYSSSVKKIPIDYRISGTPSLEADGVYYQGEQNITLKIPEDTTVATKNPDGSTNFAVRKKISAKPFTQTDVYNVLFHELTHIIDPKTPLHDERGYANSYDSGADAYYNDPKEIDAFQSEITNALINYIATNPNTYKVIENWLRNNQPIDLNQFSVNSNAVNAFNYWYQNSPDIIKKLKQRIYSSLQSLNDQQTKVFTGMQNNYINKNSQQTPPAGTPPAGTPPAGTPPAGTPPAGTPPADGTQQPSNTQGAAIGTRYDGLSDAIDKMLASALDKNPTKESLCEITGFCQTGGSISRIQMPNFASTADQNAFLEELKSKGVGFSQPYLIDPDSVYNTQTNVVTDKIAGWANWNPNIDVETNIQNMGAPRTVDDPVLISSDNYILDGHHRWAYAKVYNMLHNQEGSNNFGPVIKIESPLQQLLQLAIQSPSHIIKSDLDDALASGDSSKGVKYNVTQARKQNIQGAYIDNNNNYIVNNQVLGKLIEDASQSPLGKTGIHLTTELQQKATNTKVNRLLKINKTQLPTIGFISNYIGKLS